MHFCSERQIDTVNQSEGNVVAFLTNLYDEGLTYSVITAAMSILSSVLEIIHKRDIGKEFFIGRLMKVSKGAKIRNRYNQVPHLTQDTYGKVINLQLDTINESQEVSPFPAGDHKAHINRCVQRHSKHKTEQKHKRSTKEVPPWNGQ